MLPEHLDEFLWRRQWHQLAVLGIALVALAVVGWNLGWSNWRSVARLDFGVPLLYSRCPSHSRSLFPLSFKNETIKTGCRLPISTLHFHFVWFSFLILDCQLFCRENVQLKLQDQYLLFWAELKWIFCFLTFLYIKSCVFWKFLSIVMQLDIFKKHSFE